MKKLKYNQVETIGTRCFVAHTDSEPINCVCQHQQNKQVNLSSSGAAVSSGKKATEKIMLRFGKVRVEVRSAHEVKVKDEIDENGTVTIQILNNVK